MWTTIIPIISQALGMSKNEGAQRANSALSVVNMIKNATRKEIEEEQK